MRALALTLSLLAGCGAGAALGAAPAARLDCGALPAGLGPLVAAGAFTIFGELHGTGEIPAFAGAALCHAAAAGGPVLLGLEIQSRFQGDVDAYLASDGGAAARAALLAGEHWKSEDGRASRAMLGLIEKARKVRATGGEVRVFLFDGVYPDGVARDRGMAAAIAATVGAAKGATVLVLTGNLHARVDDPRWMAAQLAREFPEMVSLTVAYAPGEMFGCSPDGCGVAAVKGAARSGPTVVHLEDPAAKGWHGSFYVGPVSASPPAVWPEGRPMPPQPRSLRAQAIDAYDRKDYATCVRLFDESAAKLATNAALAELAANDLYSAACCHALAGETDAALESLDRALAAGFKDAATMEKDPDLTALHGDPRWPQRLQAARR